jgi:hypothetical protein
MRDRPQTQRQIGGEDQKFGNRNAPDFFVDKRNAAPLLSRLTGKGALNPQANRSLRDLVIRVSVMPTWPSALLCSAVLALWGALRLLIRM